MRLLTFVLHIRIVVEGLASTVEVPTQVLMSHLERSAGTTMKLDHVHSDTWWCTCSGNARVPSIAIVIVIVFELHRTPNIYRHRPTTSSP